MLQVYTAVTRHSPYNSDILSVYVKATILKKMKLYANQLKYFINKNNDYV
jgi:hypothetical protein